LREVFLSVVRQTGGKFTCKNASDTANTAQIKDSLELLTLAGLVYPVTHSASNGIPIGAESNPKHRKFMMLDTGIYQSILGLTLDNFVSAERLMQVNRGALAEIFVGLEILKSLSNRSAQNLYYWQREAQGSSAEVDYVVQREQQVIPVEVKAGSRGSMQSLHLFLKEKNTPYGIRCSFENFSEYQNVKVYPLFAAGQICK
jgi:predicted AAA+ superfamily ATPase